jgi:hypothetical protein
MILYLLHTHPFFLIEITKQISILSIFRKGVERKEDRILLTRSTVYLQLGMLKTRNPERTERNGIILYSFYLHDIYLLHTYVTR